MTDEMIAREEAICEVAGIKDIGDLSDGFHTFNQLYYQRMILFATIVKQNRDKAWKSLRHEDGELCFGGGWFIVGVDTPEGSYTYHYEDNYYSMFDCVELERAKHWDGHTEKDVTRLLSLPALKKQEKDRWIPVTEALPEEKDAGILKKLGTNKQSDYVLATVEVKGERMTVTACTYDGKWNWNMKYAFPDYKIIAWRPIPEAFEVEEKE